MGMGSTGTSLARGVGSLPGLGGLRNWADETEQQMQSYWDPQGTAGTIGTIGGRVLGEGATTLLGGSLAAKGLAKIAPRAAQALQALQGSERLGARVLGNVLPVAPVDAALGAGADRDNPLRGAALNVGLDVAGAGLFEGVRQLRNARAAKTPSLAASTPEAQAVLSGRERVAEDVAPLLSPAQKARQKVADDVLAVREFGRRVGGTEAISDQVSNARGYLGQTDLALGRFGADQGGVTLKEAQDAAKGIDGDVQAYLRAKRALGLQNAGMGWKLNATPDDAAAVVAQMEARPEVMAAADKLNGFYRRLLEMRKNAGLISPDAYDAVLSSGDPYVPFVRDFGGEEVGDLFGQGGKAFVSRTGLRRMKAGEASSQIVDAYQQAVLDAQRTYREVGRANVFNTMRQVMDANPELAREFIEQVPHGTTPKPGAKTIRAMVNGTQVEYLVKDPDLYEAMSSVAPPLQSVVTRLLSVPKEVLRFGVTFMPSFGAANATRDAFFTAGQFGTPLRSALGGGALGAGVGAAVSPEDRVGGALKGAAIGVGAGAMAPHAMRILGGVAHAVKQDDLYKQWLAEGGSGMGWFSTSRPDANAVLRRLQEEGVSLGEVLQTKNVGTTLKFLSEVVAHPIHTVERINEVLEQAPRLASFADALTRGQTASRAAALSRDVSVDFARRGADPLVRFAGATEAFWNPKIQGLDKLGRAFNPMTPEGRKAWAIGAMTMTAPTLGLFAMNKDNPDYWNVPIWQRNMFWLVPYGKDEAGVTKFLRVPKPFEPGMVFASGPERMLEFFHQRDPERTGEALKDMFASVGQGLVPMPGGTAVRPLLEIQSNRDLFRQRDIVNPALARLPNEEQYDSQTSSPALLAGRALGVSPKVVDHMMRGYGGTAADFLANDVLTPMAQSAGLDERVRPARRMDEVSRFSVKYTGPTSESVNTIYRRYQVGEPYLTKARQLIQQDPEQAKAYVLKHRDKIQQALQLQPAVNVFSDLSRMRRTIEASTDLTPEQKRVALLRLNATQMRAAQQYLGGAPTTP